MLKRFAQLAGLTLLLGLVFVPAAHAGPRFSFSIGVGPSFPVGPYAVPPGPPPGYIWQPGYYVRSGFGDRWVPGAWVPAPYAGRNWSEERWEREREERWGRERRDYDRDRRDWGGWRDRSDRRDGDWNRGERGDWRR
jgi:hypothetical protein